MSIKLTTQGILTGSLNPSNVNIFLNADFHDRYSQTTGWDTGINGTELATSWGGYNAGVANPTTCHHAHLTTFGEEQEYVYEYIKENETWLGISQGSLQSKLTIGQTYTFSCEQYITSGSGNYLTGGLYYKKASTNTQGFHLGSFNFSSSVRDEWRLCIYTFTVPNDINLEQNVSWYIYGNAGTAGTIYMRKPKLEVGSEATLFNLSTSEGATTTYDNFQETLTDTQINFYKNYIDAKEFVEF